jgi:hypothetical protein
MVRFVALPVVHYSGHAVGRGFSVLLISPTSTQVDRANARSCIRVWRRSYYGVDQSRSEKVDASSCDDRRSLGIYNMAW